MRLQYYLNQLSDLKMKREQAGGKLDTSIESKMIESLDELWREMTESERDEAESRSTVK